MARRPTGPQCARGPRSEAIPGKCGCCKGCRSTKIFRATLLYWSWSWGIRSILQYCNYYEQLGFGAEEKGGQLLSQVPPCSTGQGVCRNVVLQRTPKLGGHNRALKPPNDPSGHLLYKNICSQSLRCAPQFSAGRYVFTVHLNFLVHVRNWIWGVFL